MDKIVMKNMVFFGYHGAMEEEAVIGQRFYVDAELCLDLKNAGQSDDVNQTLHYGLVFEKIKAIVEKERYNLIEALAHRICINLLQEYPLLDEIKAAIRKPSAPVNGIFDYMAVEVTRTREDMV